MIRVLHMFHEMGNGGIEHFVMDYYRHIDRTKVQFDFLVSVERDSCFDEEIRQLGGRIYHAYPLKKNPVRNFNSIADIVKKGGYQIVHRHTGSAFGYYDLRAARKGGAKHLILHSHNNLAGKSLVHTGSKTLLSMPCEKLACSEEAGQWLFGRNASFTVIRNAINCEAFRFSDSVRRDVRSELNVGNSLLVGHVGRFGEQKNHKQLLEIFRQLHRLEPDAVLALVGSGELFEETCALARQLGIEDHIRFLGDRDDVNRLMQAFDVFCLPSLYEGLPFSLVEAQTSGLSCIVSDRVPTECNITGSVSFVPLAADTSVWAERLLETAKKPADRSSAASQVAQAGYDITVMAERLCTYYENL